MLSGAKPPAEVTIDRSVVTALLQEQHGDLAHLPLREVAEGWDNKLFRLGDDLVARFPRRAAAAVLIENEQRWLPLLSPRLPVPIPSPLRVGRPGAGFPWSWSVVPWLPGQSALMAPFGDVATLAVALGAFLRTLHQPAPRDAPHNPWRSIPLSARETTLREHLRQVEDLVDNKAILAVWERARSTPEWSGQRVWIHGDLHPGNVLVSGGHLSAVIDFGDLAAGDPATDLSLAWMLLPSSVRQTLLTSADGQNGSLDGHTVMRARGWALALGLAHLANSENDDLLGALGHRTIDSVLRDGP